MANVDSIKQKTEQEIVLDIARQENEVGKLIAQLKAMLAVTYGESGNEFRNLNEELQDNYMWGAYDMIERLEVAFFSIPSNPYYRPIFTDDQQAA